MTERKSRAFKLNVVDIIITLLVVGIVAFGAVMIASAFGVSGVGSKQKVEIEYTIQFNGILDEFVDNVDKDEIIVDGQKRYKIGKVKEVWYTDYIVNSYNEDNSRMEKAVYPDHKTLYVKVVADGYKDGGKYYISEGNMHIYVGAPITMHAPDLCSIGYVSDIVIKEGK